MQTTVTEVLDQFTADDILTLDLIRLLEGEQNSYPAIVEYFRQRPNRELLLTLLDKLIEYRDRPWGSEDPISVVPMMFVSYLLGLHQQVEDCLRIWDAKTVDFDTYCAFDIQLVVFAGLEKTVTFLKQQDPDDVDDILTYILDCEKGGAFQHLDAYFKNTGYYYTK